jgi:hypothetical protein
MQPETPVIPAERTGARVDVPVTFVSISGEAVGATDLVLALAVPGVATFT